MVRQARAVSPRNASGQCSLSAVQYSRKSVNFRDLPAPKRMSSTSYAVRILKHFQKQLQNVWLNASVFAHTLPAATC
jgi:hypothetical protein